MFCPNCGTQLPDDSLFCSSCGARVDGFAVDVSADTTVPPETVDQTQKPVIPETQIPQEQPYFYAQGNQSFVPTDSAPAYQNPQIFADGYGYAPAPQPGAGFVTPVLSERENRPKKEYKKISGGKKVLSVFLMLFAFLFGFISLTIASVRIGLSENNVRSAYRSGKLSDFYVSTDQGDKTIVAIIQDYAVDASTKKSIGLSDDQIKDLLEKPYVNSFMEDMLVSYSSFLLSGKTSVNDKSAEISAFLDRLNIDLKQQTGYKFPESEMDSLLQRITDGDLSFLTLGSNGNTTVNGFDMSLIPFLLSVWMIIISAALAVMMILLIFLINRNNPPTAFGFGGLTFVIFGGLNLLIALSALIFSLIKNVFFISKAVTFVSIAMGTISLIVLAVGIILLIIRKVLLKNAVIIGKKDKNAPAAA